MKTRRLALLVSCLLVAIATQSYAQVTKSGPAYKVRMAWRKGDVFKYRLSLSITMPDGQTMPNNSDLTIKVISVKDGIADVEVESIDPITKAPVKKKAQMDAYGPIGEDSGMSGLSGQRLPKNPIKLGESWTISQTVKQGNISVEVKSTYTLRTVKAFEGVNCAIFDVKATTTKGFVSDSSGTIYLESKNGQMYRLDSLTKMTMGTGAKAQTIMSKTSVSRIQ